MNVFSNTGLCQVETIYHSIDTFTFNEFCQKNRYLLKKNENLYLVLFWLYNQFKGYKEFYDQFQKHNGFEIFEICKTSYSPNCACFAIMLNDLLISLGYKSKAVWCLSSDHEDNECHALNHVWVDKLNSWIVMDPSSCSIICNEEGMPIDLLTMRETIYSGRLVYPHRNKTIRQPRSFIIEYNNYMRKNIFQFLTHREQGLSYPLNHEALLIHPIGYTPRQDKKWEQTTDISYIY